MIRRCIRVKIKKIFKGIGRIISSGVKWVIGKLKKIPPIWSVVIYVALGVGLGLFVRDTVITKADVVGDSMIPTYYDGDTVLVNRLARIDRGDLVVVLEDDGKYVIKRVVGMPGDKFQIKDGLVFINGEHYSENYIYENNTDYDPGVAEEEIQLGTDEYFILGDNRVVSKDSREIGPVTKDQIIGEVIISL